MSERALLEGLKAYVCALVVITLHEFGHAWMAWKRGDDTARLLGRVTLNPIAHIDLLGTVILPLLAIVLGASGSGLGSFIIGWGKPVPVNPSQLKIPRLDDVAVAMAGPAMNVLLAIVVMGIARLGYQMNQEWLVDICLRLAMISMFLCFFNLLPIPPLDGSHVVKNLIGMTYATYAKLSQFGFVIVIVVLQFRAVQSFLSESTKDSLKLMGALFQFPMLV